MNACVRASCMWVCALISQSHIVMGNLNFMHTSNRTLNFYFIRNQMLESAHSFDFRFGFSSDFFRITILLSKNIRINGKFWMEIALKFLGSHLIYIWAKFQVIYRINRVSQLKLSLMRSFILPFLTDWNLFVRCHLLNLLVLLLFLFCAGALLLSQRSTVRINWTILSHSKYISFRIHFIMMMGWWRPLLYGWLFRWETERMRWASITINNDHINFHMPQREIAHIEQHQQYANDLNSPKEKNTNEIQFALRDFCLCLFF